VQLSRPRSLPTGRAGSALTTRMKTRHSPAVCRSGRGLASGGQRQAARTRTWRSIGPAIDQGWASKFGGMPSLCVGRSASNRDIVGAARPETPFGRGDRIGPGVRHALICRGVIAISSG
jgi:hypothetical protein